MIRSHVLLFGSVAFLAVVAVVAGKREEKNPAIFLSHAAQLR